MTTQMLVDGLVLLRQQRAGMVQTDSQFALAGRVSAAFVPRSHLPRPSSMLMQVAQIVADKSDVA